MNAEVEGQDAVVGNVVVQVPPEDQEALRLLGALIAARVDAVL